MKELSIFLEEFYNNISHSDPIFKMNLKLQSILNDFKKGESKQNMQRYCNILDSFEDDYGIMFLDAEGTPFDFCAKRSYGRKTEWRCWRSDIRRGWVDCGWSFTLNIIKDIFNLYKQGFTFDVRKIEDVIS